MTSTSQKNSQIPLRDILSGSDVVWIRSVSLLVLLLHLFRLQYAILTHAVKVVQNMPVRLLKLGGRSQTAPYGFPQAHHLQRGWSQTARCGRPQAHHHHHHIPRRLSWSYFTLLYSHEESNESIRRTPSRNAFRPPLRTSQVGEPGYFFLYGAPCRSNTPKFGCLKHFSIVFSLSFFFGLTKNPLNRLNQKGHD